MSDKKKILVTGATGAQGGSVARHLLAAGKFSVRGLTRHPDSEKALSLRKAGAEVVQGDLENLESLRAALKDCYGVFGVTNFWEHFTGEYQEGINLVDAVAAAKVPYFIFSSLPHVKKLTKGELDVPHFDLKGQIEEYARSLGLKAAFIHPAFYYENFLAFFPPKKKEDGSFGIGFPQGETPLSGVAAEDIGGVVRVMFEQPDAFRDKVVGIVGDDLTGAQYAEIMSRGLGVPVTYEHIPREVFASFGFPGAEDLANMFDYNRRYIPNRKVDIEQSRALYPQMQSFSTWMQANKGALAAALGLAQRPMASSK